MSQIILDAGSGNTCKNDKKYVKRMIDELSAIDTGKHEVIIKWQLFKEAGANIPLKHDVFDYAYYYADRKGYKTTSSVFDKDSLDFLLQYDVPFIKLANNKNIRWLLGEIPRKIRVLASNDDWKNINGVLEMAEQCPWVFIRDIIIACVSRYPATLSDYEKTFQIKKGFNYLLKHGVSDHTTNWDLFNKYKPEIYEVHYKLDDSTGLDAGEFARTPTQLKEIL